MPREPLARRLLGALRRELILGAALPPRPRGPAGSAPERAQPGGDPHEVADLRLALRRELERLAARESGRRGVGALPGSDAGTPAKGTR